MDQSQLVLRTSSRVANRTCSIPHWVRVPVEIDTRKLTYDTLTGFWYQKLVCVCVCVCVCMCVSWAQVRKRHQNRARLTEVHYRSRPVLVSPSIEWKLSSLIWSTVRSTIWYNVGRLPTSTHPLPADDNSEHSTLLNA